MAADIKTPLGAIAGGVNEDWTYGGFGLYIHWPFCQAKCPYCDFNSHVTATVDHAAWAAAYVKEIERVAAQTKGRVLQSIYFGGGTPSLMAPKTVQDIINAAHKGWRFTNEIEVTLEANPTSIEAQKFTDYRLAGVNRVSIGVQALNDDDLRRLGRLHSADEALEALDVARETFERVSFDLIYARQHQTEAAWSSELEQALALGMDHLSLYQLTIEDGTAFGQRYDAGKLKGLPDDDRAFALFEMTRELCGQHGLVNYEVSNYARAGYESAHNLLYWHYGDYIGIGPGAHGRVTLSGQRYAVEALRAPQPWLERTLARAGGAEILTALSAEEQAMEFLLMGLRVSEGVSMARLTGLFPDVQLYRLDELKADGFIEYDGERLAVTQRGLPLLNTILYRLTAA